MATLTKSEFDNYYYFNELPSGAWNITFTDLSNGEWKIDRFIIVQSFHDNSLVVFQISHSTIGWIKPFITANRAWFYRYQLDNKQ